jgi:hypothetical protein
MHGTAAPTTAALRPSDKMTGEPNMTSRLSLYFGIRMGLKPLCFRRSKSLSERRLPNYTCGTE